MEDVLVNHSGHWTKKLDDFQNCFGETSKIVQNLLWSARFFGTERVCPKQRHISHSITYLPPALESENYSNT